MSQFAFVVDVDRCIGCKGCMVACKNENDVALGANRNIVYDVGPMGTFPDLEMYFLPVMCQQCQDPACVKVCPTNACHKNPDDGVIYIDQDKCIACKRCQKACPYGAITFNKERRVMDKCNICLAARQEGDTPACVRNCSGVALHYGDLEDPESEVSKMLAAEKPEHIYHLPDPEGIYQPSARYILRHEHWQDAYPADLKERKGGRING